MICEKCGKEIESEALFCPFCGKKQSNQKNPKKKIVLFTWGLISTCIVIILAIALTGICIILCHSPLKYFSGIFFFSKESSRVFY